MKKAWKTIACVLAAIGVIEVLTALLSVFTNAIDFSTLYYVGSIDTSKDITILLITYMWVLIGSIFLFITCSCFQIFLKKGQKVFKILTPVLLGCMTIVLVALMIHMRVSYAEQDYFVKNDGEWQWYVYYWKISVEKYSFYSLFVSYCLNFLLGGWVFYGGLAYLQHASKKEKNLTNLA